TAGACQPVENCVFGPPLAIQNPAVPSLATCVINVIATDASGSGDPTTGAATVDIPLVSRVYLTGNEAAPCPQCACGTPPCSGTCSAGPNAGMACSTNSPTGNPATVNIVPHLPGPGATSLPADAQIVPAPPPYLPCVSLALVRGPRTSARGGREKSRSRRAGRERTGSPARPLQRYRGVTAALPL